MNAANTLSLSIQFKVTHCCHLGCGTPIAMPIETYDGFLKNKGRTFYCCWGHPQSFTGPTEADRLKSELQRQKLETYQARQSVEWWQKKADQRNKTASAYKGQVTRLKNRVKHGLCPCCRRTFSNLQRHMGHMHPDYATGAVQETDE